LAVVRVNPGAVTQTYKSRLFVKTDPDPDHWFRYAHRELSAVPSASLANVN